MPRFGYALSGEEHPPGALVPEFVDAGHDHVYVHLVGPEQERFLSFYAEEVLPRLRQGVPA